MKILLLNVHSPHNAGDLAILQETIACLYTAFPHSKLTIAINDLAVDKLPPGPTYVGSFMHWMIKRDDVGEWIWRKSMVPFYAMGLLVAAIIYRTMGFRLLPRSSERRCLLKAYYDADVVAVVGGGHLYARHAFNIAFAWLWLGLALAIVMKKPLVLLPQSFGPLPGKIQRRMLRWLLTHSTFAAAREYHSLQLLAKVGLKHPVLVLPDMAFTSKAAPPEAIEEVWPEFSSMLRSERPTIGLTLMDWQGQNPQFKKQQGYETAILSLIRHIQHHYGAQVIIFAQCTGPTTAQDDRHIARRITSQAAQEQLQVYVQDIPLSPELLKQAYSKLDLLIATRMHSAIFALSAGVPTLVIGYLHKSMGIMEMLGLKGYALDIETVDANSLCTSFDTLWGNQEQIRQHLAERIPAMQSTLASLPTLIRQSLEIDNARSTDPNTPTN